MDEPTPDISEVDQKNALALAIVQPGNFTFALFPFGS
jgi:hypothetical protein